MQKADHPAGPRPGVRAAPEKPRRSLICAGIGGTVHGGRFEDFAGTAEEARGIRKLKAAAPVLGRESRVDLDFTQMTKQG
ncbi:hypothetical protein N6L27_12140 [Leisingera sp. SS27]|uniref:hypothetical protein n=1 Tax=Leisingera sp. SS27 TaxID=2979462 RepID=UPI00232CBE6F|nr:hypothetical protein [Leisingera sp. SS27]MDC0658752.1 hypothetical protein [Leisingera sp. SS27]